MPTALHLANNGLTEWVFELTPDEDLVCINKGHVTGTGTTELHVVRLQLLFRRGCWLDGVVRVRLLYIV